MGRHNLQRRKEGVALLSVLPQKDRLPGNMWAPTRLALAGA